MESADSLFDGSNAHLLKPNCFGEQCRKCEQYWHCEIVHGNAAEQWGEM